MSIKLNNQIIAGLYESQVIPQADTVNSGIIRIATQKEVDDGTDNTTAVTPFYLKQNVAENVKADGVTVIKNDDNSLTVIGQKSINNIITIDWIGTKEEYETAWNNKTITSTTVCYITDDEEEASIEGVLFIPHTERVENGIIISWTNNQGYQNPDPVLIPFVENNVPLGGTTGQILAKKSDFDYILEWIDNDYSLSKNKPQINNIELIGNKTLDELNIQIKGDYATIEELNTKANISDLSDVATSGNYNDLENKPLIPSKTSDLVNDSGFINGIPDVYVTEEELNSKGYITEIPDTVQLKLDNTLNTTSKTVVGGINELVNKKADKEDGKSLISDTEIIRLSGVTNYDDTQIKQDLLNKVDKVEGKSLISDTEIVRLSGVTNYDDTSVVNNIADLQINKSNTSLDNLTPEGEKHFLNYSQVTNCITEIPQDIKLELNDGVLTLKAGSKIYMPNGFEDDGTTPKFDEVVIESDKQWNYGTGEFVILISNTGGITGTKLEHTYSGTSSPTIVAGVVWYDTTNNIIKRSQTGTDWEEKNYALPISVVTTSSGSVTSINQTFNGFGYIGSTVFVTKGVKGLRPNGRNEDGSLNNIEFTTSRVKTRNHSGGTFESFFGIGEGTNITWTSKYAYSYNEIDNRTLSNGGVWGACVCGELGATNGQITSFTPKLPFRAVDYSDKSEVSGWAMPSSKYIDLTLGASGTTYTAPANGWFTLRKVATSDGSANDKYCDIYNNTSSIGVHNNGMYGFQFICTIPALKGDIVQINYNATGNTNLFRFIYAEGEV